MKGNAVMRAKRTHGPTPNAELCLTVKLQRCSVAGCGNSPVRTIPTPGDIVHTCVDHLTPESREYMGETPDVIIARILAKA